MIAFINRLIKCVLESNKLSLFKIIQFSKYFEISPI